MILKPARRIRGRVSLPGDKSISHRAAIIASLANGSSHLSNFASSDDCLSTLSCLRQLGVNFQKNNSTIEVDGVTAFQSPSDLLDCGNSGSTMRMLSGVLAAQSLTATLTGDSSLLSRPMNRVIEPLKKMGAQIDSQNGRPPLVVKGTSDLVAIDYQLPVPSAQVKSAVLLAGMYARGTTTIRELRGSTRDHTERMLNWFGVPVESKSVNGGYATLSINGTNRPIGKDVEIPGDVSSAAYLVAAAALLPGSELEVFDVGLNPTRIGFLVMLQKLGLELTLVQNLERCNEPVGSVQVRNGADVSTTRGGIIIDGVLISQLIDELPLLAVVATQIEGGITFKGAQELRFKESDRIASTVENLRRMGIQVDELADGLRVFGPQTLQGAQIETFGDHRIAMAFSVAALLAKGESEISDTKCVSVSFPEFFEKLDSLIER